jgi:L-threonylcarbamoyladenylate synthase
VNEIDRAVRSLRAGGLVAFPTETVYGLGADATNAAAVAKIFAAKGRPATNPLIVHVADEAAARRYASIWPDRASRLAQRFWPGPLTLVLPRRAEIAESVAAGGATVGLRVPDHPLALQLLRAFNGPVAAPSANRSNRVSPTTAAHVRDEVGDAVGMILDGGPCRVGIESTVLDLSGPEPTILRPGGVSRAAIEAVIGPVRERGESRGREAAGALRSPGQLPVHYAPRARAYRFDRDQRDAALARFRAAPGRPLGLVLLGEVCEPGAMSDDERSAGLLLLLPDDPESYARNLYGTLRSLDDVVAAEEIWVEMPPDLPAWAAVRDRLLRATKPL